MKHMERFRKMINVALKNEWMEKDPFKAYKLNLLSTKEAFLQRKNWNVLKEKNFILKDCNM